MKRSGRTKCKCNPIMRSERTIKQTNKPFNKLAMLENTGDYAREEYANHEQTIVAILVPSLLPPDYDKKNFRRNFATLPIKTKDRRRKTEDQDSRPDPPSLDMSLRQVRICPPSPHPPPPPSRGILDMRHKTIKCHNKFSQNRAKNVPFWSSRHQASARSLDMLFEQDQTVPPYIRTLQGSKSRPRACAPTFDQTSSEATKISSG